MDGERDIVMAWVAREIVPHERAVRDRLSRRWRHAVDVEDVVQEAYCRLANLAFVDHIDNPASYFHRTVHSIATDMVRRAGIINFTSLTQADWSNVMDSEPSVERTMEARQELERVDRMLSGLSATCRRVIELRRIEGLSRKETAERLGVSENDVKNQLVRGLQKIMKTMADQDVLVDHDKWGDDGCGDVERRVGAVGKYRLQ